MSMLTERLQILVTTEQRRRLDAEARRRGSSVATVVRQAIDSALGEPTLSDRRYALQAIAAMEGRYLTPQELEAVVDEERDNSVPGVS
ncbi:MAG: antitoxin [Actinomycetota bacterium]|nr:antitoxin [Actinomycetota bacterium]